MILISKLKKQASLDVKLTKKVTADITKFQNPTGKEVRAADKNPQTPRKKQSVRLGRLGSCQGVQKVQK